MYELPYKHMIYLIFIFIAVKELLNFKVQVPFWDTLYIDRFETLCIYLKNVYRYHILV